MDPIRDEITAHLVPLNLPAWQYHPVVGSTNDLALAWAQEGAADSSLVLADSQTAGRGREARTWVTRPGVALAMSLILRPDTAEAAFIPRFTALAALGLVRALSRWGLSAQVKWPNDVLLNGRKVAGVLVEGDWHGDSLAALVIGMGVNVATEAVPPANEVRYPATSVEAELGQGVDRWVVLAEILHAIQYYRQILTTAPFLKAWNDNLAFKGQTVGFHFPNGQVKPARVERVQPDGRLKLQLENGEPFLAVAGEIKWLGQDGGC
jgi:BirA family biotin operon repressor/biotin-[acetyl-CoA-carboxylase] ligase